VSAPGLYDVAIVGFGPVGAVAAGLLGQAGFSVFVCERMRGVYELPRALSLDHEIMRIFQQLGVVDAISAHCEPFTPSEYFGVDGQLIKRMTMLDPPYPQGYTPSLVFTQPDVERILRARVAALPNVRVLEHAECTDIQQNDDSVTLTVNNDVVNARWLIGCDGASSRVRSRMGIALSDLGFDEPWLVVDVFCNERGLAKLPKTSVQYCEPNRPCSFLIGPSNHRRWEIALNPGEDPKQVERAADTWSLLARWITPEDGTLWRRASYRFHALVAERWRVGRVLIAGDAAHMQPPFLGQGMCQGLRDVANLSWKLAEVLRGTAPSALLDSYEIERKQHVIELSTRIKAVGALICERDLHKARQRDAQLLDACGGVVQDTPRQDILPPLRAGAITATSGAGLLFPQPRLHDARGSVLMDERHGYGLRLVTDGVLPTPTWPGVTIIDLSREHEVDAVAQQWLSRHGAHAALLRPDHYTFGTAASVSELELLGRSLQDTRG
jgi:3-(3-hydroxy-phenyl)propionate hydroxylase